MSRSNGRDKGPNIKKKGRPSDTGTDKAGLKDVGVERLDVNDEMAEKYTEGSDELPADNIFSRHPNRNLNKPDIDKPAYS